MKLLLAVCGGVILFAFFQVSCAQKYNFYSLPPAPASDSYEFSEPYDLVWEALQEVLETYPVLYADRGSGIITTDYIPTFSYENMVYGDSTNVTKYGYFAYSLPGHATYSIVAITEPGSPAHDHLFPLDIILNYDKDAITSADNYTFLVSRGKEVLKVPLAKASFKSKFSQSTVLQGRLRMSIRVKELSPHRSHVTVSILEEQQNIGFDPKANAINLGKTTPVEEKGYKKILFMKILEDAVERLRISRQYVWAG